LTNDKLELQARTSKATSLFVISKERFTDVIFSDKNLVEKITKTIDDIVASEKQLSLDYVRVQEQVRHPKRGMLKGAEALKAVRLSLLLKNTIMQFILKNRE